MRVTTDDAAGGAGDDAWVHAFGGAAVVLVWFVVWFIADRIGDREELLFAPVNIWAGFLLLALALDLSAAVAGSQGGRARR